MIFTSNTWTVAGVESDHDITDLLRTARATQPSMLAGHIQILYDGALVGSKIERSTKPVTAARQLAERLIAAQRSRQV